LKILFTVPALFEALKLAKQLSPDAMYGNFD
jgi:hypothetical protein